MTGKWISAVLACAMAVAVPAALAGEGGEHTPRDGETQTIGGVTVMYESSAIEAAHRGVVAMPIAGRTPVCMDCHTADRADNFISTQN